MLLRTKYVKKENNRFEKSLRKECPMEEILNLGSSFSIIVFPLLNYEQPLGTITLPILRQIALR